jgi:hypothetical protein
MDIEKMIDLAMGHSSMSASRPDAPVTNDVLNIANAALQAVYGTDNSIPQNGTQTQSRILVLHNMVSDEDFATSEDYEGLKEEVKEECQKFGSLISIKIPHPTVRTKPSLIHFHEFFSVFLNSNLLLDRMALQRLQSRKYTWNMQPCRTQSTLNVS